jgi:hypothetical protein
MWYNLHRGITMAKAKKNKDEVNQNNKLKVKKKVIPPIKKDLIEKGVITFDMIREALYNNYNNVCAASRDLNIDDLTLTNYIKKYDELKNVKEETKERRNVNLRQVAIESLLSVATANNMDGMQIKGLIGSKVKASETLLKYTGDLVDKVQSTNTNLNVETEITNLSHLSDEELDKKMKEYKSIEKALKSE